jgi:hypothetical protein
MAHIHIAVETEALRASAPMASSFLFFPTAVPQSQGVVVGGFVIAQFGGRTGGRRTKPLYARVRRKLDLL